MLVEKACRFLVLALRIHTVLHTLFLYLGHMVLMTGRVFRISVGAEGVDAPEGILEQDPLFLLRPDVACIVALDIGQACAALVLDPHVVI